MKTLLFILTLLGLSTLHARVITIDPTREEVDYFPTWNLGYQDAVGGDTIFVTQAGVGTFSSNSGTDIQKKVTVVGPGYDLFGTILQPLNLDILDKTFIKFQLFQTLQLPFTGLMLNFFLLEETQTLRL